MARARDLAFLRHLSTSGVELMTSMPVMAEGLRRLVPGFSLSMIRVDERCAPREHYSEHFDEASHRLFASAGDQFSTRSEDPAAFGNLLRNRRAVGTLIETRPEYIAGATYQYLFKRNGIHHCLDVALRDGARPLGILGMFREEGTRRFNAGDVEVMEQVYGLLVHAICAPPVPADFDEAGSAMLLVDPRNVICAASPLARVWLEDATGGPARAQLVDKALLPEACRHVAEIWRRGRGSVEVDARSIPTLSLPLPGGRLRLRAYGLGDRPGGAGGEYVGIQLTLEMHRGLRALQALDDAGLSPQQQRLAYGLWRGRDAGDLRSELGVTTATMKSYMKELYLRLDVRSRAELAVKVDEVARGVKVNLTRHRPRTTS